MKNSEPILAEYLTRNRFNWKYEEPIDESKPAGVMGCEIWVKLGGPPHTARP